MKSLHFSCYEKLEMILYRRYDCFGRKLLVTSCAKYVTFITL